jgi:branched-chain amino acid transport system ATP-binding protein
MLAINKIDVFYGDLQALWDVSMAVDDGQVVTLVGSNGAGKSTIMQAITGLVAPKSGSITFDGVRIDKLPAHRIVELGISMVPEGRRLFPQMTILENLEVGASVKVARKARMETLGLVYGAFPILESRSGQKAGTLSGGEQQMLAIGRALMSRPRLLLVDEMSLGLSPLAAQMISEEIRNLNNSRKLAILLVEQDVQMALSIAHRGYVIESGHIVGTGEARELMCSEEIREAYLGIGNVAQDG